VEASVHRTALKTRPVLLVIVIAALLSGCLADNPYVSRSTLQAEAAAKLRYPGVTELSRGGHDREMTIDGPLPAVDGTIFGADADRDALFSYYDGELRRLGWQQDGYGVYRTTVETDAWGWCKPRMTFRVAIEDQSRAFQPSFYKGQTYRTVFEANLQGRDADVPCPKR